MEKRAGFNKPLAGRALKKLPDRATWTKAQVRALCPDHDGMSVSFERRNANRVQVFYPTGAAPFSHSRSWNDPDRTERWCVYACA